MRIITLEVAGFAPALKGMRNPMNSWDKGDTVKWDYDDVEIGDADMDLAKRLIKGGSEHSKFLRQIQVWADVDMPRYWWSEADTYHFNSKNSCSTMHKLLNKDTPIKMSDFVTCDEDNDIMMLVVRRLNEIRAEWIGAEKVRDSEKMNRCLLRAKRLLSEGFLQLRTWNTNYAELMNMYHQRKHHRLKEEWIEVFCTWCESLPYFKELCVDK